MPEILCNCGWCPCDPIDTISASPKGISPGGKQHESGANMQESGASTRTQISLLRGQSHYARLRRGTVIGVLHGTVSIRSRVDLEHATLAVQTPLHQGGVYCVQTSGRFEINARGDVALWLVSPVSVFQKASMASWVAGFLGRFTVKPGRPPWRVARRRA